MLWASTFIFSLIRRLTIILIHGKNKGASWKRSCVIPFLPFFKRISIRQKSGWSDLRDQFYMNYFLIEWLPTKFHRVPIWNAQVMAIWKFCYRQLLGKSGWSVKKRLDRYQTLQLHADAWKEPAYQIIAWSARNWRGYPIFSLLVGRAIWGGVRP